MKRRIFATVTFILLSISVQAQDYSPYHELSIKTLGLSFDRNGYIEVRVAVTNHSSEPRDANFECTLVDANNNPYTSIQGPANSIPPSQTVAAKALGREKQKPVKAFCRIILMNKTR